MLFCQMEMMAEAPNARGSEGPVGWGGEGGGSPKGQLPSPSGSALLAIPTAQATRNPKITGALGRCGDTWEGPPLPRVTAGDAPRGQPPPVTAMRATTPAPLAPSPDRGVVWEGLPCQGRRPPWVTPAERLTVPEDLDPQVPDSSKPQFFHL